MKTTSRGEGLFTDLEQAVACENILSLWSKIIEKVGPYLPLIHPDDTELIKKMKATMEEIKEGSERFKLEVEKGEGEDQGKILGLDYQEYVSDGHN